LEREAAKVAFISSRHWGKDLSLGKRWSRGWCLKEQVLMWWRKFKLVKGEGRAPDQ